MHTNDIVLHEHPLDSFQNFTTTIARKDHHGRTVFVVVLVVFVVSGDEDNFENCEGGRESIQKSVYVVEWLVMGASCMEITLSV
jgi:hypothetical protein